jgi:hypothetical protein
MISTWSEWKRYPRAARGENIEAPISPGLYEVRFAGSALPPLRPPAKAAAERMIGRRETYMSGAA